MTECYTFLEGQDYPLGATATAQGVNFALFSQHAEKVEICLFDETGDKEIQRIELPECTDSVWHVFVDGLSPGALYGYRVYGPYAPEQGHRFNHNKLLLDPYARQLHGQFILDDANYGYVVGDETLDLSFDERDNAQFMPKCVVPAAKIEAPIPGPAVAWHDTVIYEAHLKGFTELQQQIPEAVRGTYQGFARPEQISYLKDLGVTSVELLPVQGFVEEDFLATRDLKN